MDSVLQQGKPNQSAKQEQRKGKEHNRKGGKAEARFGSGLCSPFVPHAHHSNGTVAQTAPHNRLLGEGG